MTEWFDIPGYEGLYQIRADGTVRNAKTNNYLSGNVNSHGYMVMSLTRDGKKKDCKLHRLLALTFLPNPNNFGCINHKDGDKLNNSLGNLEWCTKGYNNRHAREVLGVEMTAKPVCQSTLSGDFVALWVNISAAAKSVGVTSPCITDCCEGRAETAGGFVWNYAGKIGNDFVSEQRRLTTMQKIMTLKNQISLLEAQL